MDLLFSTFLMYFIFFYHIVTDTEFMLALLIHFDHAHVGVISSRCTEAGGAREFYFLSPDCLGFLQLVWCQIGLSILKRLAWRWAPPGRGGRGTRWQR